MTRGRSFDKAVVATVTYNNEATIGALLDSLLPQQDSIVEVVVVDNGSRDGTEGVVQSHLARFDVPVTFVSQDNVGFGRGMNTAARSSAPDAPFLCVNPDVVLAAGVIQDMLTLLREAPRAGIVTAPLVGLDGEPDTASRRRLPTLGKASVYGLLGSRTPAGLRYNSLEAPAATESVDGLTYTTVEATTGALVLVSPAMRDAEGRVFDEDYWMYGEDLQLCLDCQRRGLRVLMLEGAPSTHTKGVSSGWPRSKRSDRAFHHSMWLYYRKNLSSRGPLDGIVAAGIAARYAVSRTAALLATRRGRSRAATPVGSEARTSRADEE
jgi:GT2 family glycosyltransferase